MLEEHTQRIQIKYSVVLMIAIVIFYLLSRLSRIYLIENKMVKLNIDREKDGHRHRFKLFSEILSLNSHHLNSRVIFSALNPWIFVFEERVTFSQFFFWKTWICSILFVSSINFKCRWFQIKSITWNTIVENGGDIYWK